VSGRRRARLGIIGRERVRFVVLIFFLLRALDRRVSGRLRIGHGVVRRFPADSRAGSGRDEKKPAVV